MTRAGCSASAGCSRGYWIAITRIAAGPENDDEQHRQEEQDHRHGELGRQRGGLLLGFRHAHVAVFLRHHAQRLAERRAVALGLLQRDADRLARLRGRCAWRGSRRPCCGPAGRTARRSSASAPRRAGSTASRSPRDTLRNAASIDMPDSTQISSRSSASGKARRIDSWRFWILFLRKMPRQLHADIGGEQADAELDRSAAGRSSRMTKR